MSRDHIRGFAAGLLFAVIVFGSYYYIEEDTHQETSYEHDSKKSLSEKNATLKESAATDAVSKGEASETSQPETIELQITNGMGSDDIARILVENKIIDNTHQFETYLKDHDLTKKIQIGTFQITKGMSFTEISNIIIKTP